MNHFPLYCPICNGMITTPSRQPIVVLGPNGSRDYYLGMAINCTNCAAVTEIENESGNLLEFPRANLTNLLAPYNGQDVPHTTQSLGYSFLSSRRES